MRIRSIKPEFWTSVTVGALDVPTRLLFIGLWNYADDEGRAVDDPRLIRAHLFPFDDLSPDDIEGRLDALALSGLIIRYTAADGQMLLFVTNFKKHQIVNRPNSSKFPPVSEGVLRVSPGKSESSLSTHGGLTEDSFIPILGIGTGLGTGLGTGTGSTKDCSSLSTHGGLTEDSLRKEADLAVSSEKKPEVLKSHRAKDPLWDAFVSAFQYRPNEITKLTRGKLNNAVSNVREVGGLPEEVPERVLAYRLLHPTWECTPIAVATHWPELDPQRVINQTPVAKSDLATARWLASREESK